MEISPELDAWLNSNIADNGHHILSPSGYPMWNRCTGSMLKLSEARSKNKDIVESVEGTLGHYLLEICITLWVSPLVLSMSQIPVEFQLEADTWCRKITGNKNNSEEVKKFAGECFDRIVFGTFTDEMRNEIEKCYQRILVYKMDGWEVLPESKVSLEAYFGHKHCDGTSDVIMYKGTRLIVVDLKYGKAIEVAPDNNGQAQLYGGGACAMLWRLGITIDQITIVIMQPRINNGVWKVWETNYNELYKFLMRAKDLSIRALNVLSGKEVETYDPNEKSCMWCHRKKGKDFCKARHDHALTLAKKSFMDAGVVEGQPKHVGEITTDALASILLRTPFIVSFLKDVADEAHERAKKGIHINCYKIVKGRSARSWKQKDNKELLNFFTSSCGILPLDCVEIKTKSPAQIGKLKLDNDQKKLINDATHFSFGSNILVPDTDKREAIKSHADLFREAGIGVQSAPNNK